MRTPIYVSEHPFAGTDHARGRAVLHKFNVHTVRCGIVHDDDPLRAFQLRRLA